MRMDAWQSEGPDMALLCFLTRGICTKTPRSTFDPFLSLSCRPFMVNSGPMAFASICLLILSFVTFSSLSVSCAPAVMMSKSIDWSPKDFSSCPKDASSVTSTPAATDWSHSICNLCKSCPGNHQTMFWYSRTWLVRPVHSMMTQQEWLHCTSKDSWM